MKLKTIPGESKKAHCSIECCMKTKYLVSKIGNASSLHSANLEFDP